MKEPTSGGGFEMDDPLARAEIEILAVDHDIEIAGLESGETVALDTGQGMKFPAHAPTQPTPTIVVPRPIPPGGIRALLLPGIEVAPLQETELASLDQGAPIVFSVTFSPTDAERVDLRQFRAVATQAANLDRRLVIAAFAAPDG